LILIFLDESIYYGPSYVNESELRNYDSDELIDETTLEDYLNYSNTAEYYYISFDPLLEMPDEDVGWDVVTWEYPNEAIDDNFFGLDHDFSFLDFVTFTFMSDNLIEKLEEKDTLISSLPFLHYYNTSFLSSPQKILSFFSSKGSLNYLDIWFKENDIDIDLDEWIDSLEELNENTKFKSFVKKKNNNNTKKK